MVTNTHVVQQALIFQTNKIGYYEGRFYSECCDFFDQICRIDPTFKMLGGVASIACSILAGSALHNDAFVMKAVSCLMTVLSSSSSSFSGVRSIAKSALTEYIPQLLSVVSEV